VLRRRFDLKHLGAIERLLTKHGEALALYRRQKLHSVSERHKSAVDRLFADFERLLGPVGAAKALHLMAPRLFPIWDRTIASAYSLRF
jgi:hypothetical protein